MPHPTAVLNVVGLTDSLIGDWSPHLQSLRSNGHLRTLTPSLPAVTTTVQSSMLTGLPPGGSGGHGIVGNGWYNREMAEVQFWKQSNHLVHGEKVWETARKRDASVTCANMFWWYNMYSSADFSITPRPIYKADGRKIPDCYSHPAELRDLVQSRLGRFPLFQFWGPATSIKSSMWIAEASMIVHEQHNPTLMLIYLPHLDYDLQRFGTAAFRAARPELGTAALRAARHEPGTEKRGFESRGTGESRCIKAVTEIDEVIGDLLAFFRMRRVRVIVLSEYGIEPVHTAVYANRLLREDGAIAIREEQGLELLDAGASQAFVVADHQVAHVYVKDQSQVDRYARFLGGAHGVERALTRQQQVEFGIDHERSGDIVLVAEPGRWFTYDYWLNDSKAPDFARTVDIHRKPGYDPRELFLDPTLTAPKLRIARKVLMKKLGFRSLMDVIPLDTSLVRGSHGRLPDQAAHKPVLLTEREPADDRSELPCESVRDVILEHLFED